MNLTMEAATNPGAYTALELDYGLSYAAAVVAGIGLFTVLVGICIGGDGHAPGITMLALGVVLTLGGAGTALVAALQQEDTISHAEWAYADDVSDWLDDEYGIETSSSQVDDLIAGDTITAEIDGEEVQLKLMETAGGDLQVSVAREEIAVSNRE